MVEQKRGRGRPPNSGARARADEAIARTVLQLLRWGFTLRSHGPNQGVAELVALEAARTLSVVDSDGLALGPDRVRQIFNDWYRSAGRAASGWKLPAHRAAPRPWTRVVLNAPPGGGHGLAELRPLSLSGRLGEEATLQDYIAELLRHGGRWPHATRRPHGDPHVTEKGWAEWRAAPRLRADNGAGG